MLFVFCTLNTGKEICQNVYIVNNGKEPLLGRPLIEAPNLIKVIGKIQGSKLYINTFLKLFSGLGLLEGGCIIRVDLNVKPVSVTAPRSILIPLLTKVKEEIHKMELFL